MLLSVVAGDCAAVQTVLLNCKYLDLDVLPDQGRLSLTENNQRFRHVYVIATMIFYGV